MLKAIDWSVFDKYPESTCTCNCVYARLKHGDIVPTFQSHAKWSQDHSGLVSRKPCPECRSYYNLRSVSSGD